MRKQDLLNFLWENLIPPNVDCTVCATSKDEAVPETLDSIASVDKAVLASKAFLTSYIFCGHRRIVHP